MMDAGTRNRNISETAANAEDILGQFYYAFGQGAGAMRVRRSAISALRARYFGPIQTAGATWDDVAGNVLSFVAQVGRLAALLATEAGRTAINSGDFMKARRLVEASVHHHAESRGLLIAGPLCPQIADELPETEPQPASIPEPGSDHLITDLRSRAH